MSNKIRLVNIERLKGEIKKCVKCGACASYCPVFTEDRSESALARGKNMIIKGLLSGEMDFSEDMAKILNKCTLCMACTEICPAKSPISTFIVAARADKVANKGLAFPYSFIYRQILTRRRLFGNVVKGAARLQGILLPKTWGTTRHLPLFLSALGKGRNIPAISSKFLREQLPESNPPQTGNQSGLKVGYFSGCMTDFVFPELGVKIVKFLNRQGVGVRLPREQGCCGAPVYLGAGDFETGRKMADANVRAFKGLDYVICDCASCASALKDYVIFLADNQERKREYAEFAGKIKDITEYLVDILKLPAQAYQVAEEYKGKRITYHEPCHMGRHLGIKGPPRKILQALQETEYVEMPNAGRCCGMAGSFSIYYYELSKKIAKRKLEDIRSTKADIVVTGCPGCQIQLMDNITQNGLPQKVLHILDLVK